MDRISKKHLSPVVVEHEQAPLGRLVRSQNRNHTQCRTLFSCFFKPLYKRSRVLLCCRPDQFNQYGGTLEGSQTVGVLGGGRRSLLTVRTVLLLS